MHRHELRACLICCLDLSGCMQPTDACVAEHKRVCAAPHLVRAVVGLHLLKCGESAAADPCALTDVAYNVLSDVYCPASLFTKLFPVCHARAIQKPCI